jgi:hypothetical protein
MYIALHVKYQFFLSDFNESYFFPHILETSSFIKFHENPASVSRAVPRGQTDRSDEALTSQFCECSYKFDIGFQHFFFINIVNSLSHSGAYEYLNSVQDKCRSM